jgi:hypothetical protein
LLAATFQEVCERDCLFRLPTYLQPNSNKIEDYGLKSVTIAGEGKQLLMGPCLPEFTTAFTIYCMDFVTLLFFIDHIPTIDYIFFTLRLSHRIDPCPPMEVEMGV